MFEDRCGLNKGSGSRGVGKREGATGSPLHAHDPKTSGQLCISSKLGAVRARVPSRCVGSRKNSGLLVPTLRPWPTLALNHGSWME